MSSESKVRIYGIDPGSISEVEKVNELIDAVANKIENSDTVVKYKNYINYCDSLQVIYHDRLVELINNGKLKEVEYNAQ